MSNANKSWNLLKMDADRLGRVTVEDDGRMITVDPRDRMRVCDSGSDAAEAYTARKRAEMEKLVARVALTGKVACEVGEKGHLEFYFLGEEG
jgi:hypothetical protein